MPHTFQVEFPKKVSQIGKKPRGISPMVHFKIAELYGGDIPKYLEVKNKNLIVIKAEQYEGAGTQEIQITPKDVVEYYKSQAGNISSGVRTLSTFTTDWRMVDNIAKESLEIFKAINRKALEKEGKKFGMDLK